MGTSAVKKFLEFNGKTIYFLAKDGQYWVAMKPIGEVLEVNFSRQLRTVKADPILKAAWSLQTMQVGDDQMRKYACIAERFVYGWIFSIRSESKKLQEYKRTCYNLLFDYFHGSITSRETLIADKTKAEIRYERIMSEFLGTEQGMEALQLEKEIKLCRSGLRNLDRQIEQNQLPLFNA